MKKEKKIFGNIFSKAGLYDDVKVQEIKPEVKKVYSEDEDEEGPPPDPEIEDDPDDFPKDSHEIEMFKAIFDVSAA